ncbi:MAG: CBS domain-containing protein [Phycisphaerales bacterium]|nr:MAG: CBS domain-containing protein [Phycisphaerales bacterium]
MTSAVLPSVLASIPGTGLVFGLLLGAAIVAGYLARMVRVPRVVGYLLAGVAMNFLLRYAFDAPNGSENASALAEAEKPLQALKDLALGLILFSIGSVFEAAHLRSVGRRVLRICVSECGWVFALVFVGTLAAAAWTERGEDFSVLVCLALFLGLAAIATAPAATLFVLHEYDAKGPMTDTILSLTAVNNIACIVLFHVAFQVLASVGLIDIRYQVSEYVWLGLLLTTVGSALIGVVLGFAVSVAHAKLPLSETILIFFALFIVLGAGERWLLGGLGVSYNFLLTALFLGAVFSNIAIDSQKLYSAIETMGTPVFVGFFALAGYRMHLEDIPQLGVIGAVYIACRTVGKVAGSMWGRRWAGEFESLRPFIGFALLCQAAVVIGLADFISTHWAASQASGSAIHPLARKFEIIVLGSVVLFELGGPLLVKWTVRRSGEVKAITLLRRPKASAVEGESMVRLTLGSLLRTVGLARRPKTRDSTALQVKHIMRTNVKFIRAEATLDEVLHFVERSRYNHFAVVDDDDELLGVIHFSDIRDMIYDPAMRDLVTAVDLADAATPAVPTDLPLTKLLQVFTDANLGSLPVIEKGGSRRTVGIVEQRDLLRTLHLASKET